MFDEIKECLDKYNYSFQKASETGECTDEDAAILDYFDLYLAETLIKNNHVDHEKIAKIILAFAGIKEKVQIEIK